MSIEYITTQGDRVDYIAWKQYGSANGGNVEEILKANPHIAAYGAELPVGVRITLPEIETSQAVEVISLWD